ncbi:hypothetical protein LguiB_028155 [Lonicera macranthoides]
MRDVHSAPDVSHVREGWKLTIHPHYPHEIKAGKVATETGANSNCNAEGNPHRRGSESQHQRFPSHLETFLACISSMQKINLFCIETENICSINHYALAEANHSLRGSESLQWLSNPEEEGLSQPKHSGRRTNDTFRSVYAVNALERTNLINKKSPTKNNTASSLTLEEEGLPSQSIVVDVLMIHS